MTAACDELLITVKRQRPGFHYATGHFDHFQILAISSGNLCYDVGTGGKRAVSGEILILPPRAEFVLWCEQGGYRGLAINRFDGFDKGNEARCRTASGKLQKLLAIIEDELTAPEPDDTALLQQLARAACRLAVHDPSDDDPAEEAAYWAQRSRQAIDNHIGSDLPLRAIFDSLGLGYRQLTRHFMSEIGMTPKQYQMVRRIEEAQRLLEQTTLPIHSIAYELGFPSSQHFATQFRRITGNTPSRYREQSSALGL